MKKRNVMSNISSILLFTSAALLVFALTGDSDPKIAFYILFFLGLFCFIVGGVLMSYCYFVWDKAIKEINKYYDTYESWYLNDNSNDESQVMTNLSALKNNTKAVVNNAEKYGIKVVPNSKIIQNTAYLDQLCTQDVLTNKWYENHALYDQVSESLQILNDEWYKLATDVDKKASILQKGNDALNLQKGNVKGLSNEAKTHYYIKLGKQIHK